MWNAMASGEVTFRVITSDPALCHRQFLPAMFSERVETDAASTRIRQNYTDGWRTAVIGTKADLEFAKCKAVPCIVRISFNLHFACVYGRTNATSRRCTSPKTAVRMLNEQ